MLNDLGIHNLWLFILAAWALNITPGPDVFYTITSTLRGGLRAGFLAIAGILSGCLVHVFAATVGISALVATSATAFQVLKWIGAAYLIFIGYKMITSRGNANSTQDIAQDTAQDLQGTATSQQMAARTVFVQGFLSNALNPKVALFFLAFLPQFIRTDAAHPTLGFFALGMLFIVNSLPIMLAYVGLAAWVSRSMGGLQRGLLWLERAAGALFIGFGIKLALSER
jgi:threonine/homoserine/homoserine lactone efflux protein